MQTDLTGNWTDEWLSGLVHRSALAVPAERLRQERFVVGRMATSLVAMAGLPLSLLGEVAPELLDYWAILILAPLASVFVLSRWGRLGTAQAVMSTALTFFVAKAMAAGGGPLLLALPALLAVPLEAASSGSRRGFLAACLLALLGLPLTLLLQNYGMAGRSLPAGAVFAIAGAVAFGHVLSRLVSDRTVAALLGTGADAGAERDAQTLLAIDDLVTWHDGNGIVLRSNGACTRLLGASPSSIHGNGLFTRIHVADRPAFLKAISDAANGSGFAVAQLRVQTGEGPSQSTIWIEMRANRLVLPGDDRCAAVAVIRDITEHRRHAEELDAMRREAVSASEGRAQLLATVSHEMRTPLNAIIGYSEILMGKGGPILLDRREGYAQIINQSSQHMLGVVNTLLDLSAIEAGHYNLAFETIDLAELIGECCTVMALPAEQGGIVLKQELAPGLPALVADRRACRQILLNLLSNAVKFTPQGGQVTVEVRHEADAVTLAVRDTGVGVAQDELPRLGMPFYQGSTRARPEKGNGLGLSVVRGLVTLHQGRLRISSAPGNGTCVKISLPVDAHRAAAAKGLVPAAKRPESDVIVLKTG
ncbi:ATP-binding protein [Microvirga sp. GCM10011540]|uniref:sensor histidine kinase n=1 Tax=Microvirga sp. GCM10011540 TaxID=3317338 RepID=UPI003609781D